MPEDIIRVQDQFYILATSSQADDRTRVLKQNDTFAVFDRYGDIQRAGLGEQGIYHGNTRHLSLLSLRIDERRPLLLSSTLSRDNSLLTVDLANPEIDEMDGQVAMPAEVVHILRSTFVWQESCYERLEVNNYGLTPVRV